MFLNNRYLDPTLGRFISVDPLVSVTRDAYGYAGNNPIAFSDPTGLCAADNGQDRQTCIDSSRSVYNDAGNPLGSIHDVAGTTDAPGTYFPKSVENSLYDTAPNYAGIGQLGVSSQLDQAQLIAFAYLQGLKNAGVLQLGSGGGLQGPTSDTRYLDFLVDYMAANVLGIQTFLHAKGAGPFDGCGWQCAVGTSVTGLFAFSLAGAACLGSIGLGCAAAGLVAGGLTSVVYEKTSNPSAKGGQLACAFFFGPSSNAATVTIGVASAGSSALAAASGTAVRAAANSVGVSVGQTSRQHRCEPHRAATPAVFAVRSTPRHHGRGARSERQRHNNRQRLPRTNRRHHRTRPTHEPLPRPRARPIRER